MRQNVNAVVGLLRTVGIRTDVAEYPPDVVRAALAQGVFVSQISTIVGLLLASAYQQMFAVWMIGNFSRHLLVQSGAFEIWYGNVLVWSTLSEGRLPDISDLRVRFARLDVQLPLHR